MEVGRQLGPLPPKLPCVRTQVRQVGSSCPTFNYKVGSGVTWASRPVGAIRPGNQARSDSEACSLCWAVSCCPTTESHLPSSFSALLYTLRDCFLLNSITLVPLPCGSPLGLANCRHRWMGHGRRERLGHFFLLWPRLSTLLPGGAAAP